MPRPFLFPLLALGSVLVLGFSLVRFPWAQEPGTPRTNAAAPSLPPQAVESLPNPPAPAASRGERTGVEATIQGQSLPVTGTPFPTLITTSRRVGTLDTGLKDINGVRMGVTCATCHSLHVQPPFVEKPEELKEFHQGLVFKHGELSCSSCHVREDRSKLRLADGRSLEFMDVISLCGQCHGPQLRDYRQGAHGGMAGYWDLSRGPRVRNLCVDCHDPHRPAYPQVMPVFAPVDRFLPQGEEPAPFRLLSPAPAVSSLEQASVPSLAHSR